MATVRNKTLQDLEHQDWGEPGHDTHLVSTCHSLRRKPLKDFTVEDIRILVGQGIGLKHLVPLAMDELERNPFAEGDFYVGDLLKCLLDGTPRDFWASRPELAQRISQVLASAEKGMNGLPEADRETLTVALRGVSSQIKYIKELAQKKVSP